MAIADKSGKPISVHVTDASPHEVKLVEKTIDQRFSNLKIRKMIGDKAYDSDKLDRELLKKFKIELIAPHRDNRKSKPTQDGRKLKTYCQRWKIERLFAWLQNFRRVVVRYERYAANFLGFVQLGCILILSRGL